jgi:hypothetical protein
MCAHLPFMILPAVLVLSAPPNAQEIVQRSVEAIRANCREERYSFTERDVKTKNESVETVRTYEVLMVEGTPQYRLVAENDAPLSSVRQADEVRKFQQEVYKRRHETREARNQRIASYSKDRDQEHALLMEMSDALDYTVVGEESLRGHDVWVLEATSKPHYKPKSREGKILTGMVGKLWIEKETYQWVRVEAQVVKRISFLAFIARADPGTSFILEQERVTGKLWLPTQFSMKVNETILGIIRRSREEIETYSNYRIEAIP